MSVKYCPKCGAKNTFEISPPEHCIKCGQAFNSASSFILPTMSKNVVKQVADDELDENYAEVLASRMRQELSQSDIVVTNIPEFRIKIEDLMKSESISENNPEKHE